MRVFNRGNPSFLGTVTGRDCTAVFNLVRILQSLVIGGLAYWVASTSPGVEGCWLVISILVVLVTAFTYFLGSIWVAKPLIAEELGKSEYEKT